MKLFGIVVAAVLVAALARPATAHHSAAQFDFTKQVEVTGTVVKFAAMNPHMRLVLRVSDAKGTREIEFEGHSTNNMYRAGYRDKMIQIGDTITVYIAPLRDGSDGGYVTAARTAKGEKFGMASSRLGADEQRKAEGR